MIDKPPEISRRRPGCILFLLDESRSMSEPFLGTNKSKADALAFAVNATLYRLVLQCLRGDEVYDYFHVGAIGYGGDAARLALDGDLAGLDLVTLSQLAAAPAGEKVGRHGEPEPFWYVPRTSGMTPMCAAIDQASEIAQRWITFNSESLPPIVLNVTDGEASDGHPRTAAARLMETGTNRGPTMLFNLQLSAGGSERALYPATDRELKDPYARILFAASSPLPQFMIANGRAMGLDIADGARGFIHNADMSTLVRFLTIGTRPGNLV